MSKFNVQCEFWAEAAEWFAELVSLPGNKWKAKIYKDRNKIGWPTVLTFEDGETMRKDLQNRSKYQVEFHMHRVRTDLGARAGVRTVEDAKKAMIESGLGRAGLGEVPRNPSPAIVQSPASDFSEEQLQQLRDSVWNLFLLLTGPQGDSTFLQHEYNDQVIAQFMDDENLLWTHENLVYAVRWLGAHNMLIPVGGRKRGAAPITPYKKVATIGEEIQAADKVEENKRALELKRLPVNDPASLEKMRKAVKEEFPQLHLSGSAFDRRGGSYTEGGPSNSKPRSTEEDAARNLSDAELAAIEKQRRIEVRNKKPRTYDW